MLLKVVVAWIMLLRLVKSKALLLLKLKSLCNSTYYHW